MPAANSRGGRPARRRAGPARVAAATFRAVNHPEESVATVRAAAPADLAQVAQLAGKLVRLHHTLDPRRFMLFERVEEGYEHFLGSELRNRKVVVLVAETAEGAIVGYAYGRLEPRDWNALRDACGVIHDLWVEEEMRGRGIAKKLLQAMIDRLEAQGAPRVVLSTAWQNTRAHDLFVKLGFRPTMIEMTRERGDLP